MIDFQNGDIFKLRNTGRFQNEKLIAPLFVSGEEFLGEYQAIRDFVIFTNKRAIAVNVQGVTGKKKRFHFPALLKDPALFHRDFRCPGSRQRTGNLSQRGRKGCV